MFVGENRFFHSQLESGFLCQMCFRSYAHGENDEIRGNWVAALQEHFDAAVRRLLIALHRLFCTEIDAAHAQIPMNFTGHIVIHRREHLIAAL